MPTVTYKCLSCNAALEFDPKSGQYKCGYCKSQFTEDQILQHKTESPEETAPASEAEDSFASNVVYNCPSCGAEVISDETTAATICVYCHNPVILSGKVDGSLKPDYILPFTIEKEKVHGMFMDWSRKKKFIQKEFLQYAKKDLINGVYYPFWVVDCEAQAGISARGEKVRRWTVGNTEYTETEIYSIMRQGNLQFNDITLKALDKTQVKILDGVQPFSVPKALPFSMTYLSGFLAEKRNIEQDGAKDEMNTIVRQSSENLLRDTISGYTTVSVEDSNANITSQDWKYSLFPVWMFTYKYKGADYYFAMNGETGKIAGRVPLSMPKLMTLFVCLAAGITGIMLLIGSML
ncbi:MAG: TFIIB-type zinc ribbon-containing protein [Eubacteriales bacterium]